MFGQRVLTFGLIVPLVYESFHLDSNTMDVVLFIYIFIYYLLFYYSAMVEKTKNLWTLF